MTSTEIKVELQPVIKVASTELDVARFQALVLSEIAYQLARWNERQDEYKRAQTRGVW